jgi:hypothetical protein
MQSSFKQEITIDCNPRKRTPSSCLALLFFSMLKMELWLLVFERADMNGIQNKFNEEERLIRMYWMNEFPKRKLGTRM